MMLMATLQMRELLFAAYLKGFFLEPFDLDGGGVSWAHIVNSMWRRPGTECMYLNCTVFEFLPSYSIVANEISFLRTG